MRNYLLTQTGGLFMASMVIGTLSVCSAVITQDSGNVIGTGDKAWSYLVVEGEDYSSEVDATDGVGFTRVNSSGAITSFLGNPILANDTGASQKGALYIQNAARHGDKVTYQVQFTKPGTYYLYMRFSMFESGVGETSYLNEDSFFLPPDFDKDPQTDWPLMDATGQNGGYTEGCCDATGYLFIPEKGGGGVRINHSAGDDDGRAYWEGKFHWNDLYSSQFLNPDTQGEPRVRWKYEVTADRVGKPLSFTVSNRESGTAIDLWLFSTNPDLMDQYSQEELDQLLLASSPSGSSPKLAFARDGKNVILSWPTGFVLESSGVLSPANWALDPAAPTVVGGQNSVTVDGSSGTKFYRLRKS